MEWASCESQQSGRVDWLVTKITCHFSRGSVTTDSQAKATPTVWSVGVTFFNLGLCCVELWGGHVPSQQCAFRWRWGRLVQRHGCSVASCLRGNLTVCLWYLDNGIWIFLCFLINLHCPPHPQMWRPFRGGFSGELPGGVQIPWSCTWY